MTYTFKQSDETLEQRIKKKKNCRSDVTWWGGGAGTRLHPSPRDSNLYIFKLYERNGFDHFIPFGNIFIAIKENHIVLYDQIGTVFAEMSP